MNREYQWFSALLCYPEAELLEALPEFQTALGQWPLPAAQKATLQSFLDYLGSRSLIELQQTYVNTFDRNRSHAMYIFEHVYGEDRGRGMAMVDLLEEYKSEGFSLNSNELPDYLPVLLEFFAQIDAEKARRLLGDAVHVLHHVADKLQGNGSPYAGVLQAVVSLSPVAPLPLTVPPVRDMDEALDTFGPGADGIEPLLKPAMGGLPAVAPINFYAQRPASPAAC